jgi:putative hemolysin
MDTSDLWKLILLLILLALSAFFSGSETAFVSLSRVRITHLVSIGKPGANRVFRLIQNPTKLLATTLTGNNLVNTAAAALGTALALKFITNDTVAVLASTIGVTLFLLVFGETLPKTIGWYRAEGVAFAVSRPLAVVELLLLPGVRLLEGITRLFHKALGITSTPSLVTEAEIRTLISVGAKVGAVEESEAALLEKVFRFGDRQVREIMTPRPEIVWVERGTTLERFLPIYQENRHTRFPVYEGSTENVVGILAIKDVLLAMGRGQLHPQGSVTEALHPAYLVPETKTVRSTFDGMQQGRFGLVLTVDEFGGIAGLATSNQLLEVIVGQMGHEGQSTDEAYTSVDEHTFRLDAAVGISEINEELHLDLPEGDYQTVAGFILDRLGRIPEPGDVVEYRDIKMTIKAMDGVRIDKVELRRTRHEQDGAHR